MFIVLLPFRINFEDNIIAHKPKAEAFGKATMTGKKEKSKRAANPNLRPWKKGQSGNPKGRPTREMQCRELLAQIGEHGDEALAIIAEVMRNPRAGDGRRDSPQSRQQHPRPDCREAVARRARKD
jgi:hypothetical protein